MKYFWYKVIILGLLVMFVCTPFAGFAPLLLIILLGGLYWFFAPIFQAFLNQPEMPDNLSNSITANSLPESTKNKG